MVNGDNVTQSHITNLKSDITSVINGNINNANINASAAIVESKITFNTTTGHTHNGVDSRYLALKHYRRGCQIEYIDATTATVRPGVLDVGGNILVATASTVLDITTDFLGGEAEPADGPVYVYAYDNAGTLDFLFSTTTPELSDASGNTAEFPLRYHLNGGVYYRLVGILHNRTDISADMFGQFDLSNFACGSFVGDGNDEIIYTGWTPHYIQTYLCSDATPANGEAVGGHKAIQKYGFLTANPQPADLLYNIVAEQHATSANATANSFYNLNAQTTAQAGSFTIDAPTNGVVTMWVAWTGSMGSV